MIEANFSDIKHSIFLYNEQLVWSGINPTDLLSLYEHLCETVFYQNAENELRGGSLGRGSTRNLDLSSQHGTFLTGPLALQDEFKIAPKVFIFNENICEIFQLLVYSAFGASIGLFVKGNFRLRQIIIIELLLISIYC